MALFGPKFDSGTEGEFRSNPTSRSGQLVDPLELPGKFGRRARVFGEAADIAKRGVDVRAGVAGLFATEGRLIKWASLRGALMYMSMALEDPEVSLSDLRTCAGESEPDGAFPLIRQYEGKISQLSFDDVLADPNLVKEDDWHLDFITWAAKVLVGGGIKHLIVMIPQAQALDVPAWYTEPVFAKCERFWNGTDWTTKCRLLDGKRWRLINSPF
jgi:Protein of unknown function (DUF2510)